MREYRGYYEISTAYVPDLGLELFAHASNLVTNRLHWQSSVEIVCRLRGEVTVAVEQTPYRLKAGDVLVIDSHLAHEYYDGDSDGLQLLLAVGNELLHRDNDQILWLSTQGPGALAKDDPEINALRTHCGRLAELCWPLYMEYYQAFPTIQDFLEGGNKHSPPDSAATRISSQTWHMARAELHSLLAILLRHTIPVTKSQRRVPTEFVRCVEYVQEHYTEPITADDVARACGFSRRSVFRLFHNYMDIPLREYLSFLRVQAACGLLQNPANTAADAAGCVGLSESQFYRVFQQITGMTPGEWQRAAPGRGQLYLDYMLSNQSILLSNQSIQGQNRYNFYPEQEMDWDWIAGRKGWDFH